MDLPLSNFSLCKVPITYKICSLIRMAEKNAINYVNLNNMMNQHITILKPLERYLGETWTALWVDLNALLNDLWQSLQSGAVREQHHMIHSAAFAYSAF